MSRIKLAIVQSPLVWQQPEANCQQLAEHMDSAAGADLYVLPEMFTTGFSMNAEQIAEPMHGPTTRWLLQQSALRNAAVCGSVAIRAAGGVVNRLLFATPDGQLQYYDKRHLFRMGNEHQHYQAGTQRVVVEYLGWRFCLQVCYDLRFPVFARNRQDYDALIYVANWPASRRQVWRTLLQARALENQVAVIGCNRIGSDDNGLEYSGDSLVVDHLGVLLADGADGRDAVLQAELDLSIQQQFQQKFPAYLDADAFSLSGVFDG
ncbi:amidohydrolase [Rheinheimera sp.]|uniref:amidohydrolase n=1 Tax=Rheinheimera sp. TaxID=1869214 RepID=UPI00307E9321